MIEIDKVGDQSWTVGIESTHGLNNATRALAWSAMLRDTIVNQQAPLEDAVVRTPESSNTPTNSTTRMMTKRFDAAWKMGSADRSSGGIMKLAKATPLNGAHKELFADGSLSGEGPVKNGKCHGKWTWHYKNGGLKAVGKYANGELDGCWEWWRENRKPLQAGSFNCGQQVGHWKRYYENGQLWDEGTYENGKKVGEWRVYDKSGKLKQSKVFKPKN